MTYSMKSAITHVAADRKCDKAPTRLVGYWLNSGSVEASVQLTEAKSRLEDVCIRRGGHKLAATECESGVPQNPMRVGLWNALRRLVCNKCYPKRMSFGIITLDEFVTRALAPCECHAPDGLDGIVVVNLRHICSDSMKSNQLMLLLAERGKHLYSEDGICMSCCNPTVKSVLLKKKALVSRAS